MLAFRREAPSTKELHGSGHVLAPNCTMHIQALEKAGRTDQLLQNEDLGMQVKEPFFTKRGAK